MSADIEAIKKILKIYVFILIASYLLSFIFAPFSYPILAYLTGFGRFDDWWNTISVLHHYPEVSEYICTIPWVYAILLKNGGIFLGPLIFYISFIIFGIAILTIPYNELSKEYGKFYSAIIIFSYPILFGFWRGNSDFFIYGLIAACYIYSIKNLEMRSLIYLGLAIAFKPYQVFYLAGYKFESIKKNKYLIGFGFISVLVLIYLGDKNFFSSSWRSIAACGDWYNQAYVIGEAGSLHNNSLWGLFKFVLFSFQDDEIIRKSIINNFSPYIKYWPLILMVTYFISKNRFNIFKNDSERFSSNFFLLSLLIALLSPITPDYRLFLINICLIIFLMNKPLSYLSSKFILIILLLIVLPKEFYWIKFGNIHFTPNGPINSILMIFLYFYIIYKNIKISNED